MYQQRDNFQLILNDQCSLQIEQNYLVLAYRLSLMTEQKNVPAKRFSSVLINQNQIRESLRKSTQEQYDQILKALSTNYFAKVASGSKIAKLSSGKNSVPVQSAGNKTPDYIVSNKVEKYLDQGLFDANKEINKIMKLGDIYQDKVICKGIKCPFQIFMQNDPKKRKLSITKFKAQNLVEPSCNNQAPNIRPKKERPKTGKINKYERVRRNKSQEKLALKFVKLDKNQPSHQIKRLKKAVQSLENIAIDQYGIVSFQNKAVQNDVDQFSEFEENVDPKLQYLENKLKEIRNLKQQVTVPEDCTIPASFLKMVGFKSSTARSSVYKRKSPRRYMRV